MSCIMICHLVVMVGLSAPKTRKIFKIRKRKANKMQTSSLLSRYATRYQ